MIEEGFIHKVINLFVPYENNNYFLDKYLELIPPVSYILYMDIGVEKALERIGGRHTRTRGFNASDKKCFFEDSKKVYTHSLDFMIKRGSKIVNIANENDIYNV